MKVSPRLQKLLPTLARGILLVSPGLVTLILLAADSRPEPRQITLVVRDMAFFLQGSAAPNPTVRVRPGEEIRIVLRNEEAGITHDFAIGSLKIAVAPLRGEGTGSVVFRVPALPAQHEYACTLHSRMMKGTLLVGD